MRVLGRSRGMLLEAERADFRQRVAIRVIAPVLARSGKAVERFHREVRILSQLESEHVARIVDVGRLADHSLFLAREYLEGESIVEAARRGLTVQEAILYFLQICEAVQEAHARGVVLRDLQPGHVFVSRRRNGEHRAQLTDFGTCKVMQDPSADGERSCTKLMGLSSSASPELLRQDPSLDERADVWSLGCLLYELVAGVPAFDGEGTTLMLAIAQDEPLAPSAIRRDTMVPRLVDRVALGALSKRRDLRPRSVFHLALGLRPVAGPRGEALLEQIARLAGTTLPALPVSDVDDDELTMVRPLRPSAPPRASIPPMGFPPAMPRPPMPSAMPPVPAATPVPRPAKRPRHHRMPWEVPAQTPTPSATDPWGWPRRSAAVAGLLVALTLCALVAAALLSGPVARRAEAGLSQGVSLPAAPVPGTDDVDGRVPASLAGGAEDLHPEPIAATTAPLPSAAPSPPSRVGTGTTPRRRRAPTPASRTKRATPAPAAEETAARGTLVAMAVGASCAFTIDGQPRGTRSSVRASVSPGTHSVGCQPVGGPGRMRRVKVEAGAASTAVFRF